MTKPIRNSAICVALMIACASPLLFIAYTNEAALAKCMETQSRGVCQQNLR